MNHFEDPADRWEPWRHVSIHGAPGPSPSRDVEGKPGPEPRRIRGFGMPDPDDKPPLVEVEPWLWEGDDG